MTKTPKALRFPHPGEILQTEFLEPMGVTQYRLAVDLKIPHSRVTAIIRGRRAITSDSALRLSRYFGTSAEFWIGLQQEFDLRNARAEFGKAIDAQIKPLAVEADGRIILSAKTGTFASVAGNLPRKASKGQTCSVEEMKSAVKAIVRRHKPFAGAPN